MYKWDRSEYFQDYYLIYLIYYFKLKILFNIVEARLKKLLNFYVCVVS